VPPGTFVILKACATCGLLIDSELLLRLENSTEILGNDSNALAAIDGEQYASIVTLIEGVVNLVPPPSDEPRDKEHQSDIAAVRKRSF
jgi:hypothetical protein